MKLSKKKLEELTETIKTRDEAILQLGNLELQKVQLTSNAYNLSVTYEEIRQGLQAKYGNDVQIDLQTGDIVGASNDLKKS
jgi:serine phosphatase RsbU (regulator of sigma subunit)